LEPDTLGNTGVIEMQIDGEFGYESINGATVTTSDDQPSIDYIIDYIYSFDKTIANELRPSMYVTFNPFNGSINSGTNEEITYHGNEDYFVCDFSGSFGPIDVDTKIYLYATDLSISIVPLPVTSGTFTVNIQGGGSGSGSGYSFYSPPGSGPGTGD
jgi:hypothetical protein